MSVEYLSRAMATLTESQAVFEAKLKDMGLEAYKDEMARRGWTTMSTFAFTSSWSPGSGDDQAFIQQVARPLTGAGDHADLPKLRKHHEAYAIVVERKTRWAQLKTMYAHLQLEPAHHVVDKFHSMRVEGELKYLAPHEIPTRDQELQNLKTEELIKKDASGHLRAHDETKLPEADTRTDLRLRQAYTRRGLALEVADVMSFTAHERLIDKMFQEYEREAPMSYMAVTLAQVAAADRRAWKLMSEELQCAEEDAHKDAEGALGVVPNEARGTHLLWQGTSWATARAARMESARRACIPA